ncbi:Ima1 N-terminal domain [Teratosphaeria destructans]|uniref:Ima1 N-terminal domain n=1 Tax=Teratosphaeria destructans TaxID=418781 RepID=A0A9W7SX44_9PEZI|nr:Ima1 N-terminal domain [Teratosphaeria destructans]
MSFFRPRIRCFFCEAKSPHASGSGVRQFQCAACEAWNFLDEKGVIEDTPWTSAMAARDGTNARSSFNQSSQPSAHERPTAFCDTCLRNQKIVLDSLSNYLPEETHPEYRKYVDAYPQYKEQLEKRYPQVCTRCAPLAQMQIHNADKEAATQNWAFNRRRNGGRGGDPLYGQRDDWSKFVMRQVMAAIGAVFYVSLLTQLTWHAYGLFTPTAGQGLAPTDNMDMMEGVESSVFQIEPTPQACFRQAVRLSFNDACYNLGAGYVQQSLVASLLLLWYNPGLSMWFHHTIRIQEVTGQKERLGLQAILLIVRAIAFFNLSDVRTTRDTTAPQRMAVHGFIILFITALTWLSERCIKPTSFKLDIKLMPEPRVENVLGRFAGPAPPPYQGVPSSTAPMQLFARDRSAPFPIASLASKRPAARDVLPSPAASDETEVDSDDGDAMDIDAPPARSSLRSRMPGAPVDRVWRPKQGHQQQQSNQRSMYNYGTTQGSGWSGMRDEVFSIQDNVRAEQERRRQEEEQKSRLRYDPPAQQNPFRGRLPQAPMSLERRLRNPPTQVSFKKTDSSKQKDFLQQMRDGIESGSTFRPARKNADIARRNDIFMGMQLDDGEEGGPSPAKTRTRGDLALKPAAWQLPPDPNDATGLEEHFGRSFGISDEPVEVREAAAAQAENGMTEARLLISGLIGGALAVVWYFRLWQPVCLWLAIALDRMGY